MASETDQILHSNNPDSQPEKIDEKWRGYYDRLIRLRDRLIDATQNLQEDAREVQPDALKNEPGEIGTESYQRDYSLAMSSTGQDVLAEVNAAIDRIKAGTYGTCEITKEPISAERLEAVPWTRYCLEGQRRLEERGGGSKAELGELGTARGSSEENPEIR